MKAGLSAAFANAATRRNPTTGEISGGFPCGPADIDLFNELVYRATQIGIELTTVLDAAGLTPDDGDLTQVLQAIQSLAARNIVVFSGAGSATWTVPAGVKKVRAKIWGAGGGGGGSNAVGTAGAGGNGGGYSEGVFAVTPGANITVTRGAGGSAGNGSGTAGSSGGTSSFGALASATGGGGGGGSTSAGNVGGAGVASGTVGTGTGGQLTISGGIAANAYSGSWYGSPGAGAFGTSTSAMSVTAGISAVSPAGGGGGGANGNQGANGAAGLVILEY